MTYILWIIACWKCFITFANCECLLGHFIFYGILDNLCYGFEGWRPVRKQLIGMRHTKCHLWFVKKEKQLAPGMLLPHAIPTSKCIGGNKIHSKCFLANVANNVNKVNGRPIVLWKTKWFSLKMVSQQLYKHFGIAQPEFKLKSNLKKKV